VEDCGLEGSGSLKIPTAPLGMIALSSLLSTVQVEVCIRQQLPTAIFFFISENNSNILLIWLARDRVVLFRERSGISNSLKVPITLSQNKDTRIK
jgi:hypothetical protein